MDKIRLKYLAGLLSEGQYRKITENEDGNDLYLGSGGLDLEEEGTEEIYQEKIKTDNEEEEEDYLEFDELSDDDAFFYKYNNFEDYIDSEFGSDLSDDEKVEAIMGWSDSYNVGNNPADLGGLVDFVTPEIIEKLKQTNVSKSFVRDIEREIEYKENPSSVDQMINKTTLAGKSRN